MQEKPIINEKNFNAIKKEDRESAIEFFEYLKFNKMSVVGNKIMYKSKRMGGFGVYDDNEFQLTIQAQFDEHFYKLISTESETIQDLVKKQNGYTGCGRCITGKCSGTHINMRNLNQDLFNFAKKLLSLRVEAIANEQIPKCNYIKIADRGKIIKCAKCKKCNPACRKLKNF